jgi:hypothetical protein
MLSRLKIIIFIITSLFVAGVIGYNDYHEMNKLCFVVDIQSSQPGVSQIFYDIGRGHNEQDSYQVQINSRNLQKYIFPLCAKVIKSIRFDPINVSAMVRIKDARVENKQGDIIKKILLKDFRAIQQINKMEISGDALIINTTENANDPILLIEKSLIDSQMSLNDYFIKRGWKNIKYGLLSLLVLIALNYFLIKATRNQYIVGGARSLKMHVLANPKKGIACIGLIAVIASCYPVVFCGKSFVSPAGLSLLYPYPPYLPGFPSDVITENFRCSDVGATAWSFVPNTFVQCNALMQYFEFPFWNRFVGGGIPLFAQGQSMIGDILHWIPISLGGSAVGWDIKFVLSKTIFATGMGLLVFRLTNNFLAGSLIAVSSCFLGFYAFRFNHPTFFVLTYTPWIIIQWDRLGEILAVPRPRKKKCVIQGLLLAAVTWLQLNAGAPKEGVITAFFMHFFGVIAFMDHVRHRRGWIQAFFIAIGFSLIIVMILSPYWLLFLDALSKSFTFYDNPGVDTFPLWKIVGFFDNFFFQWINGTLSAPSTNLFVLLCLCSAITILRKNKSIKIYGAWLLFFFTMFVAYGVVPKFILISVPFINKIQHVGDVFSMPMMILALILAGYGIQHYLDAAAKSKKQVLAWFLSIFVGLVFVYLFEIIYMQIPGVNAGKDILLIGVFFAVAFPGVWALYRQTESGIYNNRILIILACCFLLLHVRHGMHLMTGVGMIDSYFLNPTERADFSNKSCAVEYAKNRIKEKMIPSRIIGEGEMMFPGYSSMVGLEGIVVVDALRNRHFENLLTIVDYPLGRFGWLRLIKSDKIASRTAALDLLNIGYIVAAPGTRMPQGVKLIYSSDLDVWERDTVWPRAFFTNQVFEVHKPEDILEALAMVPHAPFAAVESQLIPDWMPLNIRDVSQMVPAKKYSLTNNSTKFSVDATGPGLIVLEETYYPDDFVANLNGMKVDYIRVNNAFKGIWVKKAGRYDVNFTYRPARLSQSIILSIGGWGLLLILSVISTGLKYTKIERKN